MTTDLYAKCPCGSGKKIKFCCRDIITDIERIERMLHGEQRNAALDKIDKLLAKHRDRPALLALKAQVLFELQRFDDAQATVDRLLEVEPDNPPALALKSLAFSVKGEMRHALGLLHRAMRMSEGVLSQTVFKSYLSVCLRLIQLDAYIAAYAHLLTLVSITQGVDRVSVSMLMNVASSEKLPIIFQGLMISHQCPERVTWKREFDVAIEHYRRGDWTEAAALLASMNARILDEPVLIRNLAILQAWTLQDADAAKMFRTYSKLRGLSLDDAVEAEACAQALEPAAEEDALDILAITHEIDDAQTVMEKLLSSDVMQPLPPEQGGADDNLPPAKGRFAIYDRPMPAGGEQLSLADLPRELGAITVRGRETDRSARLECMLLRDEQFEQTLKRLEDACGESLSVEDPAERIGRVHRVERSFHPIFRAPMGTSMDRYQEMLSEWISSRLSETWPTIPLSCFGGQSATQAAQEPKYQRAVLAAIMNLELWADRQPVDFDFNQLREKLGLAAREPIDPAGHDIRSLSPARLMTVELGKLPDDDLVFLFEVTSTRPGGSFLRRIGQEVLNRPHLNEQVDFVEIHERLAEVAVTTDEQLEHLRIARDIAVERGESPAHWLVGELDLRLGRAEIEPSKRLIAEIQSRYLREPGIAQALASVLNRYGLLPDAAPSAAARHVQPTATAAASAIPATPPGTLWTPDADHATAAESDSAGTSKLWIPGMD